MALLDWILLVAAFELVCFVIFGLGIATAVPEDEAAAEFIPATNRKLVLQAR